VHHHHAYWRFDFDIKTAGGNRVQEFNDPPIIGNSNWHDKNFEIRRPRDPAHKRKWRVSNKATGEAYDIIPGAEDGIATKMPDLALSARRRLDAALPRLRDRRRLGGDRAAVRGRA
jgi:hypothetical protein